MSGYDYLASPYYHDDPAVRQARVVAVCKAADKLMSQGRVIFSPIAHGYAIEHLAMTEIKGYDFWMQQDIPLLRHANRLIVLMLDGWMNSRGIRREIDIAISLKMTIDHILP